MTMTNEEMDQAILEIVPEASSYLKDTGCLKCDVLPGNDICLDCQLEMADYEVSKWMRIREELELKQQIKKEKANAN